MLLHSDAERHSIAGEDVWPKIRGQENQRLPEQSPYSPQNRSAVGAKATENNPQIWLQGKRCQGPAQSSTPRGNMNRHTEVLASTPEVETRIPILGLVGDRCFRIGELVLREREYRSPVLTKPLLISLNLPALSTFSFVPCLPGSCGGMLLSEGMMARQLTHLPLQVRELS